MSKMHPAINELTTTDTTHAPRPSRRLMRAAVSGLLGLGAAACGDDDGGHEHEELSDEELTALCEGKVEDALAEAEGNLDLGMLCEDMVQSAETSCETEVMAAEMATMAAEEALEMAEAACPQFLLPNGDKEISSEQKEYTFEELTDTCDDRGGYVQVHASCGGVNACAGFSYGDWGPGAATLTEHACAGANGCVGLSCTVLPEDSGMTGEEIYEYDEYGDPGPSACTACHAVSEQNDEGEYVPDTSKFKVWVYAGSTRDEDNWLDRTPAEQERVVAFGAHSVLEDGTAVANMAGYHRKLSRAEIERVVEHIRTLDPIISEVKTQDP